MKCLNLFGDLNTKKQTPITVDTVLSKEQELWLEYSNESASRNEYAGYYSPNGVPCCDDLSGLFEIYSGVVSNLDSLCKVKDYSDELTIYADAITLPCCEHKVLLVFDRYKHLVGAATRRDDNSIMAAVNPHMPLVDDDFILDSDCASLLHSEMPLYEIEPYKSQLASTGFPFSAYTYTDCFGLSYGISRGHGYNSLGSIFMDWKPTSVNPLGIIIEPEDFRNHVYFELVRDDSILSDLLSIKQMFDSYRMKRFAFSDISDIPYLHIVLRAVASTKVYLDYYLSLSRYARYKEDAEALYNELLKLNLTVVPDNYYCYQIK